MEGTKKRLALSLSFLSLSDFTKQTSPRKSPKNFEEPNGVFGLGIVAALNDYQRDEDPALINDSRKEIVAIPPKPASRPISIIGKNGVFNKNSDKNHFLEEMVLCEEYTCVTSHVGENLIEKREYFDTEFVVKTSESKWVFVNGSPGEVCEASVGSGGGGGGEIVPLVISNFLKSCFLCQKMLHGLDIFMYRGDKAFCSPECRHKQISTDEKKEKRRSRVRKQMGYSVSPCSDSLKFFAGVAAA